MKKIFLLLLPLLLSASMQKITVQLEWKHQFEFAGFYAAIEKGYYRDIGLDVELKEFEYGIDISADVIEGKYDFGVSSSSLILDKLKNKPVVLMSSFLKQNALVLVTSKDIKNISDLKNKKVMALPYEIEHTSLGAMFKDNKISDDDFTLIPHEFDSAKFISGEVDAMSVFLTNQLFELDKKKIEYNILNPSQFGIYSYDCELFTSKKFAKYNPKLVQDFINATNKGWSYAFEHKKEIVELIYNKYSKIKSKEALLYEAVQTQKLFKTDIFTIGAVVNELVELNALVYKKLGLVDKNVDIKNILSDYLFNQEKNKKNFILSKEDILFLEKHKKNISQTSQLTIEEKKYLKDKKRITMCIDPNWMPYEGIIDDKYTGLTSEYYKIFQEKIGIPIDLVNSQNWSQALQHAKKRECDILSLIIKTQEREKYMDFTTPYLNVPIVLATKSDVQFINDVNTIEDEKIGIPRDYAYIEILRKKYPMLHIVEVENIKDGLSKVRDGKLFGFIGSLATIGYMFQKKFAGELKIAGKFDESLKAGVAVRNDDSILFNIFEKTIQNITDEQRKNIFNKWVAIRYEKGTDYVLVWKIISIALFLLIIVLFWIRKLSVLNKNLQIANTKAAEVTKAKANFLANISHEIRTPMNSIVGMAYLIKETKLSKIQSGYIQQIESSSQKLLNLINEILDFSKIEAGKMSIEKIDFSLLNLLNTIENMFMVSVYEKDLTLNIIYDKININYLYGDKLRISQVLINLISNAIKFTEKGTVNLIIEKLDNDKFLFIVNDTGIGIKDEQLENIFLSFSQADASTSRKYGGTGLGLAISKELVMLMGGDILVKSTYGEGSEFSFIIELKTSNMTQSEERTKKVQIDISDDSRPFLSVDDSEKLFQKLQGAIEKRRPHLCEPILQEFEKYRLNEENKELFENVKILIKKYKFNEARKLLC